MSQTNKKSGEPTYLNYGIDLGTTNSCIARAEENITRIFQTSENMNTTRSAVHLNKNGKRFTGFKAYNAQVNDPENVALEFKRLMGTTDTFHFPATGEELAPEELSAEILKSLKSDVARVSNEIVTKAVITVPAAFGTLQCEATYEAAKLAGIDDIHLLQEPIAAAIAYGANSKTKENTWMVFDFGGGTLDVAIVTNQNNRLSVLNNEGNNLLGGKDIDTLIVENILLPAIEEQYELFDTDSDEYEKLFRLLKKPAEEAKIDLSSLEATTVYLDSNSFGYDALGDDIDLEIELERDELENIIDEIVDETIEIAVSALEGSGLSADSLEKIILVGGSTQIPLIRERLVERFGLVLDYTNDPIAVVAKGAAIYAATAESKEEMAERTVLPGQAAVKFQHERITSKPTTLLIGLFLGEQDIAEVVVDAEDGTWSSGWFPLTDTDSKHFECEISLHEDSDNKFIVRCRDQDGNEIFLEDSKFSIKHKTDHLEVAKPLVTSSLCIEYIDKGGTDRLETVIPKNTPLPAYEEVTFFTSKELRPSAPNDYIAIKLWEGEEHAEPQANIWVTNLYLRAKDITKNNTNRVLAKGSDVVISIEVDESRRITINAKIPKYDINIASDLFYKPTPINIEECFEQIDDELKEFYARLEHIRNNIARDDEQMLATYDELFTRVENFDIKYNESINYAKRDKDLAQKVIEQSKSIRKELSALEKEMSLDKQTLTIEQEAFKAIERVDAIIEDYGSCEIKEEINEIKLEIREAIEFKDVRGVQHGLRKIEDREMMVLFSQPAFWMSLFQYICDEQGFIDPTEAEKWIAWGNKAIETENLERLQEAVQNLLKLVKKDIKQVVRERVIETGLNR